MLRITGGEFRGRSLLTPSHQRTRPTAARLRQALFNSLQTVIQDASVLDLFAGSGSLGFEALSRGASRVVFVESAKNVQGLIRKNAQILGVTERVRVLGDSVDHSWKSIVPHAPFDLIFADPPYADLWERKIFDLYPWNQILKEGGLFCLEWGREQLKQGDLAERFPFLVKVRQKLYGDSVLTSFQGTPS